MIIAPLYQRLAEVGYFQGFLFWWNPKIIIGNNNHDDAKKKNYLLCCNNNVVTIHLLHKDKSGYQKVNPKQQPTPRKNKIKSYSEHTIKRETYHHNNRYQNIRKTRSVICCCQSNPPRVMQARIHNSNAHLHTYFNSIHTYILTHSCI